MYHMSRARDAAEGAVSYITMQLCGLLRFDKSIFTACNDGHGHLEMSVGLSEAVGFRDHESRAPTLSRPSLGPVISVGLERTPSTYCPRTSSTVANKPR